jgi:hypothetical protein
VKEVLLVLLDQLVSKVFPERQDHQDHQEKMDNLV